MCMEFRTTADFETQENFPSPCFQNWKPLCSLTCMEAAGPEQAGVLSLLARTQPKWSNVRPGRLPAIDAVTAHSMAPRSTLLEYYGRLP